MRVKDKAMSAAKFEEVAGILWDVDPTFRRRTKREARKIIRELFEEVIEKAAKAICSVKGSVGGAL